MNSNTNRSTPASVNMKHTPLSASKSIPPRRHARAHAILLCAALGSAALPAHAEGPARATVSAEDLASQAYTAYAAGKFTEAITLYMKSYESSAAAAALLNVAMIYDRNLHERDTAGEYYRRYLRAPDADSDRVKKVNERLMALKHEQEEAAQSGSAPPPAAASTPAASAAAKPPPAASAKAPSTDQASSSNGTRTAGLVTGAVGLLSLGTSGVLSLVARKSNSDANAYCTGNVCSDQRGVDLAHQAGTTANIATVTFVGGLALLGTGVVLYVLSSGKNDSPQTASLSVAPVVGPTASGINLFGKF